MMSPHVGQECWVIEQAPKEKLPHDGWSREVAVSIITIIIIIIIIIIILMVIIIIIIIMTITSTE